MPLIKLETNVAVPDDQKNALVGKLSKLLAEGIGKPEEYVMVSVNSASMLMSGKTGPACFVDIRSIGGLLAGVNRKLSREICGVAKEVLGISPERVYLNFTDVPAGNWGWNGNTFG